MLRRHFVLVEHAPWRVVAIPVLQDNFVFVVAHGSDAMVIDAGAALPVLHYLREQNMTIRQVLLTHQHRDHTAGYAELLAQVAPASVLAGEEIEMLSLPGHTAEDVGYYFAGARVVCTGDCLINGACGRVLGGRLENLYRSVQLLKALPGDTRILGGHDYLVDNLHFALQYQPDNAAIHARLARYASDPAGALFATLAEELATNPFLQAEDFTAFAALRAAKDRY